MKRGVHSAAAQPEGGLQGAGGAERSVQAASLETVPVERRTSHPSHTKPLMSPHGEHQPQECSGPCSLPAGSGAVGTGASSPGIPPAFLGSSSPPCLPQPGQGGSQALLLSCSQFPVLEAWVLARKPAAPTGTGGFCPLGRRNTGGLLGKHRGWGLAPPPGRAPEPCCPERLPREKRSG